MPYPNPCTQPLALASSKLEGRKEAGASYVLSSCLQVEFPEIEPHRVGYAYPHQEPWASLSKEMLN